MQSMDDALIALARNFFPFTWLISENLELRINSLSLAPFKEVGGLKSENGTGLAFKGALLGLILASCVKKCKLNVIYGKQF